MSNVNFDWWDYGSTSNSSTLTTTTNTILYGQNGTVYLADQYRLHQPPLATKSEWTLKYGEPPQQQPVTNAKRWITEGAPIPETPEDWLARRINEICDWSPMG